MSSTSTLPLPLVSPATNSPNPLKAPGSTNPITSHSSPVVSWLSTCSTNPSIRSLIVPLPCCSAGASLPSPSVATAAFDLGACFAIDVGHVTRNLILALMTGMGCHAINALIASSAWLFALLVVTTPVHIGMSPFLCFLSGFPPPPPSTSLSVAGVPVPVLLTTPFIFPLPPPLAPPSPRFTCPSLSESESCFGACPPSLLNTSKALLIIPVVYTLLLPGSTNRPATSSSTSFSIRSNSSPLSLAPTWISPLLKISLIISS